MHKINIIEKITKLYYFDEDKISEQDLIDRYINKSLTFDNEDGFVSSDIEYNNSEELNTLRVNNKDVYEFENMTINSYLIGRDGVSPYLIEVINDLYRKNLTYIIFDYGYKEAINTFTTKTNIPQTLITSIRLIKCCIDTDVAFNKHFNNGKSDN